MVNTMLTLRTEKYKTQSLPLRKSLYSERLGKTMAVEAQKKGSNCGICLRVHQMDPPLGL